MPVRALRLKGSALAFCGLAAALAVALSARPASAQLFFEPFAYRFQYPPPEQADDPPLRPGEIVAAARAQGVEPTSRPVRNREVYVFDARDRAGRPVRVIMDAYEGEIVRVMARIEPPSGRERPDALRGRGRATPGDPDVIEGLGPDDPRPAQPRRDSQTNRPRAPKREAAVPPRVEPPKPVETRPLDPPKPADASKPAATPATPPVAQPTEAPGPIPSPPFASGAYSKPPAPKPSGQPAPAMPPVTPLDEVKPQAATQPVPPATLE